MIKFPVYVSLVLIFRRPNYLRTHSPVATENIRRFVPVGPWRIRDGSPAYSNLPEMFKPFLSTSTVHVNIHGIALLKCESDRS